MLSPLGHTLRRSQAEQERHISLATASLLGTSGKQEVHRPIVVFQSFC